MDHNNILKLISKEISFNEINKCQEEIERYKLELIQISKLESTVKNIDMNDYRFPSSGFEKRKMYCPD